MAAKSYKYEEANVRISNAHIWYGHVVAIFKRADGRVLNVKTTAGFHVLVKCVSAEEADTIKQAMLNGLPE